MSEKQRKPVEVPKKKINYFCPECGKELSRTVKIITWTYSCGECGYKYEE